ncbi:hypothetical protein XELAEV_18037951mg [Xenopus laevis]|uniref:Uncharacterized protein n=1 Tax=Xenopus laevis TaxID=8355 RepID=A0A974HAP5_XENLA|nr:hypothetical protein XELAEV_18037951mg [Xenopus laevis]
MNGRDLAHKQEGGIFSDTHETNTDIGSVGNMRGPPAVPLTLSLHDSQGGATGSQSALIISHSFLLQQHE